VHRADFAAILMRYPRAILGFLLVYQALFLNVVLPGHTRGAVTMDGKHTPGCCCCCACRGDAHAAGDKPAPTPSPGDRDKCALCNFAAGLISVPPVRLVLPDLGLLKRLPLPGPAVAVAADFLPTYFACGPPASPAHL
jgi:hypothetical protein